MMPLTELERFLSGNKRMRRGDLLIRRIERISDYCSQQLASPLTPDAYYQNREILNAATAAIQIIHNLLSEPEQIYERR
jgi:hypothetical protein